MALWVIENLVKKGDYDYAVVKNHPNATKHGYVLYHRIVMENYLGRLLTDNEVVHHLDGDRHNNNIENLELMDRKKHSSMHMIEKYSDKPRYVELECDNCHKLFTRTNHQNSGYSKNNKHNFCSYECNGAFYAKITNNLKANRNYKKHIETKGDITECH